MSPRSRKQKYDSESVDGMWEDLPRPTSPAQSITPPSSESRRSPSITPRKRRSGRVVYVAASQRKQFAMPAVTPIRQPKPPPSPTLVISQEELTDGLTQGFTFTVWYCFDVLRRALRLLRIPLGFLLFLWLLAWIVGGIWSTLQVAFAPLCFIPGISSFAICRPLPPQLQQHGIQMPRWADYPKLVNVQSTTFEQLLDQSVGGSALSLEIKKAEMATSDLVTLVRVSHLKSRDMLAESLVEFVEDAKKTGRGLQKLSSKVGGAVDGIMAINDHALHTIEEAVANTPPPYSLKALLPWHSSSRTKEVVTKTFTDAMNVLSTQMQRLILEAELSLANLNNLEERLSTLHGLVSRENITISEAKSELLSNLWTILGGNRRELRGFDEHLSLLQNLGVYRERARIHVVTALHTLQAMSEDMADLRERVAAPELTSGQIPVEVHMKSIKNGLEGLKERRIHAKAMEEAALRRILTVESE